MAHSLCNAKVNDLEIAMLVDQAVFTLHTHRFQAELHRAP